LHSANIQSIFDTGVVAVAARADPSKPEGDNDIMMYENEILHAHQYLIGDPPIESGLCLLKILIRESHLDLNTTSSMIRTKLSNLDEYLTETNDFTRHRRMVMGW